MLKILIISLLFFNITLKAEVKDPVIFLQEVINECKPILTKKNDNLIEQKITEYMDINEMSVCIIGKAIWDITDLEKKKLFIQEFKKLILKTYIKTAYHYIDSEMNFSISNKQNKNISITSKRIQLSSAVKKNNTIINIDYRLIKDKNSWLVYDIIIEGISILKSFRTQFSEFAKNNGIDKTIEKIKELNNK